MLKDPDIRKSLVVSIITSILVLIFIDPVLKIAATWLMWLSTNLSEGWINGIYRSAALGLREKFSFLLLGFMFAMMAGVATGIVSVRFQAWRGQPLTTRKSWFRKPVISVLFLIFSFIAVIGSLAQNFAELQLNASFNQRIAVLTAKASDQQIKDLRAAWALMESRKDYETMNSEIQKLEVQLKVKLPAPLWE